MKLEWLGSIRSVITLLIIAAWCIGFAFGNVSVEAFAGTVGAVVTFYFLKHREEQNGGGAK